MIAVAKGLECLLSTDLFIENQIHNLLELVKKSRLEQVLYFQRFQAIKT